MQWEGREESSNVEDRRGMGPTGYAIGGGGILILLIALFFGVDPRQLGGLVGGGNPAAGQQQGEARQLTDKEQEEGRFSSIILRDTELVWGKVFDQMGMRYSPPTMVLFSGSVDSACGRAEASVGPFYCPGDHKVYLDTSFYRDMERKLHAPGDFARAYVIAHEVGHHVQTLLGYTQRMEEARRRANNVEQHRLSVRLELQADFLAGVWAHHAQQRFQYLDPGDVQSALNAAFQIGDDRLQKRSRGVVVPDSFTHGTSKQRQSWFLDGFKTGDIDRASLLFELPYDQL